MGVRITKCVGYGARGFSPSKDVLERLENASETTYHDDFTAWCDERRDEILAFAESDDKVRRMLLASDLNLWKTDETLVNRKLGDFIGAKTRSFTARSVDGSP